MQCSNCSKCFLCKKGQAVQKTGFSGTREELIEQLTCANNLNRALQSLIEHLPDTFFVTDGEGTILMVNEAYEKLSRIKRADLIGKNMRDMVGRVISSSATLMVLEQGKPVTIEQETYSSGRKSYVTSRPVYQNGKILFVVSSNRDFFEIDALKCQLEKEKERTKEYYEKLQRIREELIGNHTIIAKDKKTLSALNKAKKAAAADVSVLIIGETGTGKAEFAKFIHNESKRNENPFVTIDCGAITASLIESELFGYEKGAFTGARSEGRKGLLELANGGTVFLDEIGELPLDLQVKLLRVLQEHEFFRVGGNKAIRVDARFIAATNRNLQEMVQEKKFREDLFYRLSVVTLQIPPIRERRDDIMPLVSYFLQECNEQHGMQKRLSLKAYQLLRDYAWPGNVRELKNLLEEVVIMSETDLIEPGDIFAVDTFSSPKEGALDSSFSLEDGFDVSAYLERLELKFYQDAYRQTGSVRKAARRLSLSASTYARRLKLLRDKYPEDATPGEEGG